MSTAKPLTTSDLDAGLDKLRARYLNVLAEFVAEATFCGVPMPENWQDKQGLTPTERRAVELEAARILGVMMTPRKGQITKANFMQIVFGATPTDQDSQSRA